MTITVTLLDGTVMTINNVDKDHWGTEDGLLFYRTSDRPAKTVWISLSAIQMFTVDW
jgi:hypothetical protein